MKDLKQELAEDIGAILAGNFNISVTSTSRVPSADDGSITFPNFDTSSQGCKLLDTCVLYIDIRGSTKLNEQHRRPTVAKLYSAFVRGMTKCARRFNGHVRGIIGDRVMVIFDSENAYINAVDTAVAMNSASKYVLDQHFAHNEIKCGIGIDAGPMLATKTGYRRHGQNRHAYRSLVWLGRPANVASKLTDLANKSEEIIMMKQLEVCYLINGQYCWQIEDFAEHMNNFYLDPQTGLHRHQHPNWYTQRVVDKAIVAREATPPILMTDTVYNEYRRLRPTENIILDNSLHKVNVEVPSFTGAVYGGDIIFTAFKA